MQSAETMQRASENFTANITETTASVHQIDSNLIGVKQQAFTQADNLTETVLTVNQFSRLLQSCIPALKLKQRALRNHSRL